MSPPFQMLTAINRKNMNTQNINKFFSRQRKRSLWGVCGGQKMFEPRARGGGVGVERCYLSVTVP